jgi:Mg-chelatase subunit ChlD
MKITYPTRYALIDFNTSVTNTIPWTWSKSAINSRLNAIQPIGQTNYADALQAGKNMMDGNTSNCKIAIVIGDGAHNTSDIVTA